MAKLISNKRYAKNTKITTHVDSSASVSPGFGHSMVGEEWTLHIWGDDRVFSVKLTKEEVIRVMKHWNKGVDESNARVS